MMKLSVSTGLLLISVCSLVSSAVVKKNTDEDDKIFGIRAKLENLQRLLKQLSKEKTVSTVATTTEAVTKKPTTVAKQLEVGKENTKTDEDEAIIELLNKLTPQEIKLLKKLQGDLFHVKENMLKKLKTLHEGQIKVKASESDMGSPLKKAIFGKFIDEPDKQNSESKKEVFESDLNAFEKSDVTSKRKEEGKFGAFKSDEDDKVLKEVEERIVADIQYAKTHGISVKRLFEGLQQKSGH